MSVVRLTALMGLAQIVGMISNASFPALIPTFTVEWSLSGAQAGWISGVYYAGYVAAVPLLVTFTDRVDARRIYLSSQLLGVVAAAGFAWLADGFWSALLLRFFDGAALGGTYMVGARMLSDRITGASQSRAIAWYTATFGVGTAASVFVAGEAAALGGWPTAFWLGAAGHLLAAIVVALATRPQVPEGGTAQSHPLQALDPRPVLRNAPAMAYVLGYAAHIWEMFGFRTWVVAFLGFALMADGGTATFAGLTPTQIATLLLLLGLPSSVLGNEAAVRFGRRRVLRLVMGGSGLLACALGWLAAAPVWILIGACVLYGILMMADSAALTAGTVAAAEVDRRGLTMALHTTIGFGAGVIGPAVSGVALDAFGGQAVLSGWIAAFVVLGVGGLLGPIALTWIGRANDPAEQLR